jgi:hypothetical protein
LRYGSDERREKGKDPWGYWRLDKEKSLSDSNIVVESPSWPMIENEATSRISSLVPQRRPLKRFTCIDLNPVAARCTVEPFDGCLRATTFKNPRKIVPVSCFLQTWRHSFRCSLIGCTVTQVEKCSRSTSHGEWHNSLTTLTRDYNCYLLWTSLRRCCY